MLRRQITETKIINSVQLTINNKCQKFMCAMMINLGYTTENNNWKIYFGCPC